MIALSIGVLEGDEELMLGSITLLAEDSAGGIYVLDELGPIIRHFGAGGVYVGSVGRGGEGPGEYGSLSLGMVVDVTGVLHVSDGGNGRIARFSAAGDPPPITWRQTHSYDVFEADGRFLGEVRFPDDVEPLLFAAGHIWGIRRGD